MDEIKTYFYCNEIAIIYHGGRQLDYIREYFGITYIAIYEAGMCSVYTGFKRLSAAHVNMHFTNSHLKHSLWAKDYLILSFEEFRALTKEHEITDQNGLREPHLKMPLL